MGSKKCCGNTTLGYNQKNRELENKKYSRCRNSFEKLDRLYHFGSIRKTSDWVLEIYGKIRLHYK
jgi:outer membrane protein assembly factor BamD (BamD/ComL family)